MRRGAEYAGRYLLKIVLAVLLIAVFAYVYTTFLMGIRVDFLMLLFRVTSVMVTLVPLTVLAFAVGYCPEGSKDRFHIRLLLNLLASIFLLVLIHSITFDISSISLSQGGELESVDTVFNVDFRRLCALFLIVPVLSCIDAYLEYREHGSDGSV